MTKRTVALALFLTPVTLVGCGADATVAPKDGGLVGDSSNGDGGGNNDSGTAATKGGDVYVASYAYTIANTSVAGMSASAGFDSAFGAATGNCTTTTDGACTITSCTTGGSDAGSGAVPASAGIIQITGGNKPVQLVPSGPTYTAVTGQTALWGGGEQLDVSSAGAEVPAFDLKVIAPGYVTVTTPVWPAAGGKVPITRSQAFALAWTGGGAGDVVVAITGTAGSQSTSLSCTFSASGGSGSVPASALAMLPASPTSAAISITSSNVTEAVVSGWSLRVNALTLGKSTSGVASGGATIQ
ncbi:MAG TPA: hypothetical protein VF316_06110 [Polyangiaceae bacterium]